MVGNGCSLVPELADLRLCCEMTYVALPLKDFAGERKKNIIEKIVLQA